jgi:hypothetical protein
VETDDHFDDRLPYSSWDGVSGLEVLACVYDWDLWHTTGWLRCGSARLIVLEVGYVCKVWLERVDSLFSNLA